MLNIGKLRIHSSFFFLIILIIALGQIKQFFLLIMAVTTHELAHVAAARAFRLKTGSVIITPIGETAHIEGLDAQSALVKSVVILAGPLLNILTAAFIFLLFQEPGEQLSQFMNICAALGFFNLLPVYPMDGGRLLYIILGNRLGILNSVKYVRLVTKIGIALFIFAGFIQLVIFPLNASLLAIGLFLAGIFKREKASMLFSYYNCMLGKSAAGRAKTLPAVFPRECPLSEIERVFTWDHTHIIFVSNSCGKLIAAIPEKRVFEALVSHGTGSELKLLDIMDKNDYNP